MVKTLDIMDKNILELSLTGRPETFISMPVITVRDEKYYLVSFCWSAKTKQRNVPRPERICITPLRGSESTIIEDLPATKAPSVLIAGAPSFWSMKRIASELDEVINDYNSSGHFPVHKYLSYLEHMIPLYSADYRPIFAAINNPIWNIDLLTEEEDA